MNIIEVKEDNLVHTPDGIGKIIRYNKFGCYVSTSMSYKWYDWNSIDECKLNHNFKIGEVLKDQNGEEVTILEFIDKSYIKVLYHPYKEKVINCKNLYKMNLKEQLLNYVKYYPDNFIIVELKNKCEYIVFNNTLKSNTDYIHLDNYNPNLTNKYNDNFSIVNIQLGPNLMCNLNEIFDKPITILWKREIKKITKQEIANKFGINLSELEII